MVTAQECSMLGSRGLLSNRWVYKYHHPVLITVTIQMSSFPLHTGASNGQLRLLSLMWSGWALGNDCISIRGCSTSGGWIVCFYFSRLIESSWRSICFILHYNYNGPSASPEGGTANTQGPDGLFCESNVSRMELCTL